MRGEYTGKLLELPEGWELPPRARRIQLIDATLRAINGTTSACAENTAVVATVRHLCGNYLRVRGEYD